MQKNEKIEVILFLISQELNKQEKQTKKEKIKYKKARLQYISFLKCLYYDVLKEKNKKEL